MSDDRAMTDAGGGRSAMPTATVVGIDEAGYGPILGPLVVSAVAFDVPLSILKSLPEPAAGPDFWHLLRASVSSKLRKRDARLAIADSKKLHQRRATGSPWAPLERAVLTFLGLDGQGPADLAGYLGRVAPDALGALHSYAWYQDLAMRLPHAVQPGDLATQRHAIARDLAAQGIRFRGAWVEVLPEGHYNKMVGATHNKAVVLFGLTVRLIQRVAEHVGPFPLGIWIDRQGGRTNYLRPLMTAFADAQFEVLEQSDARSGYRLTRPSATWVVRFVQGGEEHHLPVALASLFSKYTRELMMTCFNAYWASHVDDLQPTAGYYQDGQRFLADIAEACDRLKIDRGQLVRMA